jgi:hypothetical protein
MIYVTVVNYISTAIRRLKLVYAFQVSEDLDVFPSRNSRRRMGVSLGGGTIFKSAKRLLLSEIHRAWNLFNPQRILNVDGQYIQVLRKFVS